MIRCPLCDRQLSGKLRRHLRLVHPGQRIIRRWTEREVALLRDMLDSGEPYAVIARRLRRTRQSVMDTASTLGIVQRNQRYRLRSTDVERILGISPRTRRIFEQRGWLRPSLARIARYDEPALHALFATRESWVAWSPDQITDPRLRELARQARQDTPAWIPLSEAARRIGLSVSRTKVLLQRGELTGVKYQNWYIREDVAAAFVPPCERRA